MTTDTLYIIRTQIICVYAIKVLGTQAIADDIAFVQSTELLLNIGNYMLAVCFGDIFVSGHLHDLFGANAFQSSTLRRTALRTKSR